MKERGLTPIFHRQADLRLSRNMKERGLTPIFQWAWRLTYCAMPIATPVKITAPTMPIAS
jgi:hypothetical protein